VHDAEPVTLDGFGCSGNYAYAFIDVPDGNGGSDEETAVLMASNGAWQFPTDNPCTAGEVPADIDQNACDTN
jgi:hypothetical protein